MLQTSSRIIAIANLKGGAGKTTAALGLGGFFHGLGRRTLIVDADPQGTTRRWAEQAAEGGHSCPSVLNLGGAKLMHKELRELSEAWERIIVDCPPRLGPETLAAMVRAHVVVIPLAPSPADAWALQQTVDYLDSARGANPGVIARALLNRVYRTALGSQVAGEIAEQGTLLLDATLGMRTTFGEAMVCGRTVTDYAPASKAAHEMRRLGREVEALCASEGGQ